MEVCASVPTAEFQNVFDGSHSTALVAFQTASRVVVNFSKLVGTPQTFRWFQVAVPAGNAEVRLRNITDGTTLGILVVVAAGLQSFVVTPPGLGGVKLVYLQHRRVAGAGTSEIEGGTLEAG